MKSDVLIIGGGVIGLASALELLEAGHSVRILERKRLGAGASEGNCGLITPSHALPLTRPGTVGKALASMLSSSSPLYFRPRLDLSLIAWGLNFSRNCNRPSMLRTMFARSDMLVRSRELYNELIAKHKLACEWEERGLLTVFATERAFAKERAADAELAAVGVETSHLSPEELKRHEPALRDDLAGASYFPQDAHLRPDLLLKELERIVREKGAIIDEKQEVTGFCVELGRVTHVQTENGLRASKHFLIATGAWSPSLAKTLRLHLPIQPGKGYSVTMPRPEVCPDTPLILAEPSMAVTPWESGLRLGGTMEFAGYDEKLRAKRLNALITGAGRFLRSDLNSGTKERWCGWRPMTPNELPIIDRAPELENLYVAAGHGMMGVSMAPATAQLVRHLIDGEDVGLDREPYRIPGTR